MFLCNIVLYSIRLYFYHQWYPQLGVIFTLDQPPHSFWSYLSTLCSSMLGTYQLGELIFQCLIFLTFNTVHGFLKARILKWLPFPSPVAHGLSELSTITCPSLVALHGMAHSFIELDRLWSKQSIWLALCNCGFQSVCPLMDKDNRLVEASWWDVLPVLESAFCSDERSHAQ